MASWPIAIGTRSWRCAASCWVGRRPNRSRPRRRRRSRRPASITPTRVCPNCGAGRMIVIREFPPMAAGAEVARGWVGASASTVRNREGRSHQRVRKRPSRGAGRGVPVPRRKKPRNASKSGARATGGRLRRVKPGRTRFRRGCRVGEDPPGSEPGGRLKYQRVKPTAKRLSSTGLYPEGRDGLREGVGAPALRIQPSSFFRG